MRVNLYGYQHSWLSKKEFRGIPSLPRSILGIAKNYPSNPNERNKVGDPIIFSKSINSLISIEESIILQGRDDVHYETELALLIGRGIHHIPNGHDPLECCRSVAGLAVGLDLTLKTIQNELKAKGASWEMAKAFDRACPISPFIPAEPNWFEICRSIELVINGKIVQKQSTDEMIFNCGEILSYITKFISLSPGDVILTGTPALPMPTQALKPGDELIATVSGVGSFTTRVIG
jgi:2-keto-4-pentenoate hydratase/2-oxohepta-3-ene-1,7-dioic acid hydratase in catechol pathway